MRYHIWTVGCQMNVADSQKLAAGLDRLGWSEAGEPGEADLVVLNTCSIRDHAEQRAISKLGTLKKARRRGQGAPVPAGAAQAGQTEDRSATTWWPGCANGGTPRCILRTSTKDDTRARGRGQGFHRVHRPAERPA